MQHFIRNISPAFCLYINTGSNKFVSVNLDLLNNIMKKLISSRNAKVQSRPVYWGIHGRCYIIVLNILCWRSIKPVPPSQCTLTMQLPVKSEFTVWIPFWPQWCRNFLLINRKMFASAARKYLTLTELFSLRFLNTRAQTRARVIAWRAR